MKRQITLTPLVLILILVSNLLVLAGPTAARHRAGLAAFGLGNDTDRDRDGLLGPVRRVKTEMVKLSNRGGKAVEGQRVVIEAIAYDIKGAKIENAYYPVPGAALTGKEVYKYDEKGNIVEMTMVNADGTLLSKEVYTYELDAFGNWTKMTTSVAVIEGGKINYEPTEVTYRSISYYLDEATLARMSQPATPAPLSTSQQVPSVVPAVVASTANQSQSTGGAVGRPSALPSAPLPSGGTLLKASMAAPGDAFNFPTDAAANQPSVRVDADAPPPAAGRPAPKPLLKPMSGGVLNGKAMTLPKPLYPQAARAARASGLVSVDVVIDENGKVISAKAIDGHLMLRGAAVSAAQGARFSPTMLSGQPVKVTGVITYNFSLQ
ncbi:MAG: periplasmic protein TonB [Acidobacteriota bacterium]|jgi:protein TonB|nr:periplasmic protein TonB [Acidobacteriota bacterium]